METMNACLADTQSLIVRASSVRVVSPPTREDAATLWSLIRTARKEAEAEQEKVCGPLKTAYEEARKPYLELRKECEAWEDRLKKAMGAYDAEQERIARAEQAKIQAKIDADNAKKIAKAQEKGKDVAEVVLKVAPVVQAPPKTVTTQAGTQQTRIAKTVYGIKGAVDNEDLTARDPRIKALLADYPDLFVFNWTAFRKVASTGMLDQYASVESRVEYSYAQRGGK